MRKKIITKCSSILLCLISLLLQLNSFADTQPPESLKVAFLSADPKQVDAFSLWTELFEQYSGIDVDIQSVSDAKLKADLNHWLESGEFDIIHWQAGKRLTDLVEKGYLTPISNLIDPEVLSAAFPQKVINQVSQNNTVYGFPFAQYAWSFYYSKPIFRSLNLKPPKTWDEFLQISDTLLENGVFPLVQANAEGWETLGWLDFLSLFSGSEALRQKLLNGQPLTDEQTKALIAKMAWLGNRNYFFASDHKWQWQQTLTLLQRKQVAMTLMGQFAEHIIRNNDIGFFPFPESETFGSVVPTDVFVVPTSSTNKHLSKSYMEYLLSGDVGKQLALDLGWLPVNNNYESNKFTNERVRGAAEHIQATKVQVQYFDRESRIEVAQNWNAAIIQAISKGDSIYLEQASKGIATATDDTFIAPALNTMHIATIRGHRGTFLASKIIEQAYAKIGYAITVNRFPTTESALLSQQRGMDAELVRSEFFDSLSDDLVRVPVPIVNVGIYSVTKSQNCKTMDNMSSQPNNFGVSSDALVLKAWAEEKRLPLVMFANEHEMWQEYREGRIGGFLIFEPELTEFRNSKIKGCVSKLDDVPLFHFINKKNAELVDPFTEALRTFKNTDEYKAILNEFGL